MLLRLDDEDTYRRARIKAAEQDTSVSALVRRFLVELAATETDVASLSARKKELRARVPAFRAGDRGSAGARRMMWFF
jgi:hypothetical protein